MSTITLPAIGTKVRALYIPTITDENGLCAGHDYKQEVRVTGVSRLACRSKDSIIRDERDVLYGDFISESGNKREYYFTDWEPVDSPAPSPQDEEIAALKEKIDQVQSRLDQTISFLGELNGNLNTAADDQNMCSSYEDFLEQQNKLLTSKFPLVPFTFEGREIEKEFTVTRVRTVTERVNVTVYAPAGTEEWRLTQMAEEKAAEDYDWHFIDEDIDEMDVEEA